MLLEKKVIVSLEGIEGRGDISLLLGRGYTKIVGQG